MYKNDIGNPNTKPSIPTNLNTVVNDGMVNFKWDKATDNQTAQNGLSYNLYIYEATNSSGSGYYQINSYTVYGTSFNYTSPNASLYYACQVSATNTAGLTGGISGFSPYK